MRGSGACEGLASGARKKKVGMRECRLLCLPIYAARCIWMLKTLTHAVYFPKRICGDIQADALAQAFTEQGLALHVWQPVALHVAL